LDNSSVDHHYIKQKGEGDIREVGGWVIIVGCTSRRRYLASNLRGYTVIMPEDALLDFTDNKG
jgi:hypothetical protein